VKVQDILDDLKAVGVYVIFIDFGVSTEYEADLERIRNFFSMAEWESRLKSKKTKWGFDEAIRHGTQIHTNTKLYGYQYIQADNRLEVIEEEAEVVRQIYELYSQGIGVRRIANMLTEQGIFTRQGESFCKSTIMRILTNEKYTGKSNRGKYDTGLIFNNKNTYPKVKDEYTLTETDKIPAIIEPELFNKCKEQMNSKVNHVNKKGVYSGLSEYTGLLYCSTCGSVYYSNHYLDKRQKQPKVYDYYICGRRKLHGKKACDSVIVQKQLIDDFFTEMMEKNFAIQVRHDWEETIRKLTNLQHLLMGRLITRDNERIEQVNSEIIRLNAQKQKWLDAYAADALSIEDMKARIKPIDEQLKQRQAVINELTKEPREFIEMVNKTKANIEAIRRIELVKHDWFPKMPDSKVLASYGDVITKDFYTKQEVMECITRIVVSESETGGISLSLASMSTTKKYQEYIESFGYDLDSIETLSDDDRISLEQKYQKMLEIYQ